MAEPLPPMVRGFAHVIAESLQGWGGMTPILGKWHALSSSETYCEDAVLTARCGAVSEWFEEGDFAEQPWSECCAACRHLIHLELGDVWQAAHVRDRMLGGKV